MALASSLQKVASKIVGKFGGAITFTVVTAGAYNTTTGAEISDDDLAAMHRRVGVVGADDAL